MFARRSRFAGLRAALGLSALMALLAACGPSQAPAAGTAPAPAAQPAAQAPAQPLRIRVGYNKLFTAPFMLIAKHEDAYRKAGVDVEWIEFQTPPQIVEAMAAGAVDAGAVTVPNFVSAAEKGVDAKLVLHLSGWSDPNPTYFVRVDSNINTVRDLKGTKIGVNNYGGIYDLYLRYMLEQNGLDPKNDVQILEVPQTAVYQALDTRQIDCGVVPSLLVGGAEERFPGKFKPLFSYNDIPDIKDRGQYNQIALAMTGSFLRNSRPAAKAFVKVVVDTQNAYSDKPQEGAEIWATEAGVRGLTALKDPFGPNTQGRLDLPAIELDVRLMNRYGYARTEPSVQQLVDQSLVDEVLAGK